MNYISLEGFFNTHYLIEHFKTSTKGLHQVIAKGLILSFEKREGKKPTFKLEDESFLKNLNNAQYFYILINVQYAPWTRPIRVIHYGHISPKKMIDQLKPYYSIVPSHLFICQNYYISIESFKNILNKNTSEMLPSIS